MGRGEKKCVLVSSDTVVLQNPGGSGSGNKHGKKGYKGGGGGVTGVPGTTATWNQKGDHGKKIRRGKTQKKRFKKGWGHNVRLFLGNELGTGPPWKKGIPVGFQLG